MRPKRADVTTRDGRSTFRDWVSAETSFELKIGEMALARSIDNEVAAAYRRGEFFE
jgi:hypothetical protein